VQNFGGQIRCIIGKCGNGEIIKTQSQGISVTPLFAVVLGTMVRRDAVIGQLIQETKFKVLLRMFDQSFHFGSRRLHSNYGS